MKYYHFELRVDGELICEDIKANTQEDAEYILTNEKGYSSRNIVTSKEMTIKVEEN